MIAEAFPSGSRHLVSAAQARLEGGSHAPNGWIQRPERDPIRVNGEVLMIPARQYDRPLDPSDLEPEARLLWLAWFTRSHDGRLRQMAIRELPKHPDPWLLPYLIQPLGEYVIEITRDVRDLIGDALRDPKTAESLREFWLDNPTFVALTHSRARSYWHVYYRQEVPSYTGYPAAVALAELDRNAAPRH